MTDPSAATAQRTRLSVLLEELRRDVAAAAALEARLRGDRPLLDEAAPSHHVLNSVALDLHAYYTCVESLLERIARTVDGAAPSGAGSHAELLRQMSVQIPGPRPRVLSERTAAAFEELRRLRHLVRHGYGVPWQVERLAAHIDGLRTLQPSLMGDLGAFESFLLAARDSLQA